MNITHWQDSEVVLKKWGILPIDNVPKDVIDYLNNNVSDEHANSILAGHIKEEYSYKDWPPFVENFILSNINSEEPTLGQWLGKNKTLSKNVPLYLKSLWVNFQKKHEFNPLHDHTGLFSFIIFLKIPYNLEDEDKFFPQPAGDYSTSRLSFVLTDYLGDVFELKLNVDKSFENKMIMFPSPLKHMVYPFYSTDEHRVTVSGNISLLVE